MSKRKGTPSNLMEGLLSGQKRPSDTPSSAQIPESQQASTPAKAKVVSETDSKTKATFYVAQDVLYDLEEAQLRIRRYAKGAIERGASKRQISKSSLVEMALQIALEELEQKGARSQLASRMMEML